MIIPIRCFTCGKVIADKWLEYERRVADLKKKTGDTKNDNGDFFCADAPTGAIMDDLGLKRICCRRHMLAHVDLIEMI